MVHQNHEEEKNASAFFDTPILIGDETGEDHQGCDLSILTGYETGKSLRSSTERTVVLQLRGRDHGPTRSVRRKKENSGIVQPKHDTCDRIFPGTLAEYKKDYSFLFTTNARRTTPIAAMMVAMPTGDFVWIGYGVCTGVAGFAGTRVCTCVWAGIFTVCCTAVVFAMVAAAVGMVVVPPINSLDPLVEDDEPELPPIWWRQ
jgi:hypothetical protein